MVPYNRQYHKPEDITVEKKERKKLGTGVKVLLIILGVIAVLLIAALIFISAYMEQLLSQVHRIDDVTENTMSQAEYQAFLDSMDETLDPDFSGPILSHEDVTWPAQAEPIESSDQIINILLIGQDRRSDEARTRSDTMILVTVNKRTNTIHLTSFMRDMYVEIPTYEKPNRINIPYMLGGMRLLNKTLYENFGVVVDGNIEVDFQGFMEIIDMMGGIEVELTAEEAEYMNLNVNWDVEDGTDKVWNLTEGVNLLTGSQALSYARMRKVGNSDFERTERQRRVLTLLIDKAKDLSLTEMNLLLQHAMPLIRTDLSNSEIIDYALELFPMLNDLEVKTLRIPAPGTYEAAYVDGMSVLIPDLEENRKRLQWIMW